MPVWIEAFVDCAKAPTKQGVDHKARHRPSNNVHRAHNDGEKNGCPQWCHQVLVVGPGRDKVPLMHRCTHDAM